MLKIKIVMNVYNPKRVTGCYSGLVYDPNGLAPTLNTMQGGGRTPFILEVSIPPTRAFRGRKTKLHQCKNLEDMMDKRIIPLKHGVWVDAYNKIVSENVSGTITVRLNPSNQRFVTELYEIICGDKNKK